jgi:arylsulfatase
VRLAVELQRRQDRSAEATLLVDDAPVASTTVPLTTAHLSFWGADVGRDAVSQVSAAYEGEFAFPAGVLDDVTIEFYDPPPIAEIAEALVHIE